MISFLPVRPATLWVKRRTGGDMTKENCRMSNRHAGAVASVLLTALFVLGCKFSGGLGNLSNSSSGSNTNSGSNTSNTSTANTSATPTKTGTDADSDGVISSGTGTEKEKPSAGKANVQG